MGRDLTILIITHNRQSCLLRLLFFLTKYDSNIKILILDSSVKKFDNQSLIKIIDENKIELYKFKEDIPLQDKISIGSKKVKTKYCVLSADDDFLMPHALIKCVEFLENNKDYASAHGYYFSHSNTIYESFNNYFLYLIPLYGGKAKSNNSYSSIERIHNYFNNKMSHYPLYAVHKTENFIKIHQLTQNYIEQLLLQEYFVCCASLIIGKMKVLPIFYCSREPNFFSWLTNKKCIEYFSSDKIQKGSIGLSRLLIKYENISFNEGVNIFKKYFEIKKKGHILSCDKNERKTNFEVFPSQINLISRIKNINLIKIIINFKKYVFLKYMCFYYGIEKSDLNNIKSSILLNQDLSDELINTRKKY